MALNFINIDARQRLLEPALHAAAMVENVLQCSTHAGARVWSFYLDLFPCQDTLAALRPAPSECAFGKLLADVLFVVLCTILLQTGWPLFMLVVKRVLK